ncbi:MAG: PAS domain-containing protein, partial [Pseudomonadota bacterium]
MRLATNQNPFQLSEPLNIIHRAWRLAVGATPIPQRHRLDPRDLKQHVERTFILEQKSTDDFRIRLAGQAVCNQIGMEIRGMPAVSMFALDDRQALTT